jgi:hypothetical protein
LRQILFGFEEFGRFSVRFLENFEKLRQILIDFWGFGRYLEKFCGFLVIFWKILSFLNQGYLVSRVYCSILEHLATKKLIH